MQVGRLRVGQRGLLREGTAGRGQHARGSDECARACARARAREPRCTHTSCVGLRRFPVCAGVSARSNTGDHGPFSSEKHAAWILSVISRFAERCPKPQRAAGRCTFALRWCSFALRRCETAISCAHFGNFWCRICVSRVPFVRSQVHFLRSPVHFLRFWRTFFHDFRRSKTRKCDLICSAL